MRLYLVRHGAAADITDGPFPDDAARPLTPDGLDKTRKAARGLKAMGVGPEVLLSSPRLRALQTARIIAETLGGLKVQASEELEPDADPRLILKTLAALAPTEALVVGHLPHLDLLLATTLGVRRVVASFKKAGAAAIEWSPGPTATGSLLWFLEPRQLRRLG